MNPMILNPIKTINDNINEILLKLPNNNNENNTDNIIKIPPIVGVPCLLSICDCGPSSLMGCPPDCFVDKYFINLVPKHNTIPNDIKNVNNDLVIILDALSIIY